MKSLGLKILSFLIVFSIVFALCSCSKKDENPGVFTTNRPLTTAGEEEEEKTTNLAVAAVAPEGDENIIKYFNDAFKIFNNRDFDFIRQKECKLNAFSAGTLQEVEGATQEYENTLKTSFSDMMGVGKTENFYYVGDDISGVFSIAELTSDKLDEVAASASGSNVTVSFKLKQITNDGETTVSALTKDFISSTSFREKLKSYGCSADSVSVKTSAVTLKAVIDYSTKNFVSVEIGFVSHFSAPEVKLDYVSGGPVAGNTKTTIIYKNFVEE